MWSVEQKQLSRLSSEVRALEAVESGVHPVDALRRCVHAQTVWPSDAVADDRLALATVEVCALDTREGAPVRPKHQAAAKEVDKDTAT